MGQPSTANQDPRRAARAAADLALREQAAALLAKPEDFALVVSQLTKVTSRAMLRYSARNIALVALQAAERGLTLTNLASAYIWQQHGRHIRKGETGLRISVKKKDRQWWHMSSVFDISQTVPMADGALTEPEHVSDPTAVLRASLIEQFERLDYILRPVEGHPGPAVLDHRGNTVTLGADLPIAGLAHALARVITYNSSEATAATERKATLPPAPAEPSARPRLNLALAPPHGSVEATVRTEWITGHVFYDLVAPRLTGTWTVSIDSPADTDCITHLNVDYGENDGRSRYPGFHHSGHPHRPVINRVSISGRTYSIPVDSLDGLNRWKVSCQKVTADNSIHPVPAATGERMAAVVAAILRHFLTRPDLAEVHRAAARFAAPARHAAETAEIQRLDQQITDLARLRDQRRDAASRLAALMSTP